MFLGTEFIGYAGRVAEPDLKVEKMPLPEYGDDGIDLTLVRWALSLTPEERLAFLQARINDVLTIRALNGPN